MNPIIATVRARSDINPDVKKHIKMELLQKSLKQKKGPRTINEKYHLIP